MIERLNPEYRFTCDRCGKVQTSSERTSIDIYHVGFSKGTLTRPTSGDVCEDCHNDFCEIAENFFDEVNKNG
jgi:hypothetical protein